LKAAAPILKAAAPIDASPAAPVNASTTVALSVASAEMEDVLPDLTNDEIPNVAQ